VLWIAGQVCSCGSDVTASYLVVPLSTSFVQSLVHRVPGWSLRLLWRRCWRWRRYWCVAMMTVAAAAAAGVDVWNYWYEHLWPVSGSRLRRHVTARWPVMTVCVSGGHLRLSTPHTASISFSLYFSPSLYFSWSINSLWWRLSVESAVHNTARV